METTHPLRPSLLELARQLDAQPLICLARVFGSATTNPASAADLDLAFFCPFEFASSQGQKFARAISSQVLARGNRSSGHYAQLDVFIFFHDQALVRNGECNGWDVAVKAKTIKPAAMKGQPWLDFIRATDPDWTCANHPADRLRQWICTEKPLPLLDGPTIASMARAGADLWPWIERDNSPRNLITEAMGWSHLDIARHLLAAGAPVQPPMPDDSLDVIEFSGQAYYPAVAALVHALDEVENYGLEDTLDLATDLVDLATEFTRAGSDPLLLDLGGNAISTLDACLSLAMELHKQCPPSTISPLASGLSRLMDEMFASMPVNISTPLLEYARNGVFSDPGHDLHRLGQCSSSLGPWLASVRQRHLQAGVNDPASSKAHPSPRI